MPQLPLSLIPHPSLSDCRHCFIKSGFFNRSCDQRKIQRFRCTLCGKSSSTAARELFYRQRLRKINTSIFHVFVSGVSQRRTAIIFGINRKTVVRKFRLLGHLSMGKLLEQNLIESPVQVMEFDDLETYEHTKCKPLSVTLAVEKGSRRVIGFEVSQMPAKGRLVHIARKKYGYRKDERSQARERLFSRIKGFIHPKVLIKSDDNPHYPRLVKKHFPLSEYYTIKGGRGANTGQGELKKQKFDPIFSINHTFAKLRADICRLFRKTWCTTKLASQLRLHIAMMVVYHNHRLKDPKLQKPIFSN